MRPRRFDGINVIPFIDVLLVLLAIVLATASFLPRGRVDLDLPEGGVPGRPEARAVTLTLLRDGRLLFDGASCTPEEAAARLRRLPPTTTVSLEADAAVPFGRFVAVLEWLDEAQHRRLTIVTRPKPER